MSLMLQLKKTDFKLFVADLNYIDPFEEAGCYIVQRLEIFRKSV